MKTPICDFIKEYAARGDVRLHMPGHKGRGGLGVESFDITEVAGADVLYSGDGIIRESEECAASIFGTERTVYSAEGSSLCIRAMVYLVKKYALSCGKTPKILAARNVHKTFITAAALLDVDVSFIHSADGGVVSCEVDFDALSERIETEKPTAVYITSPDYLGKCADIEKISAICREYGVLLLVDNAHGAYLKFLEKSRHPIDLGADMCCDSAHKTLPVLTGGAYLHISKTAPKLFAEEAEDAMSLFASTSPSYLILASLDAANRRLEESFRDEIKSVSEKKEELCRKLKKHGLKLLGDEPLKVTIAPKSFGYTGDELAERLRERGIECEFSDPDFTVMMLSANTSDEDIKRAEQALLSFERKEEITEEMPRLSASSVKLSPSDALLAPSETLPLDMCEGRIFADISVSCPPAIPIVICGEEINGELLKILKYYGVKECKVIKQECF